MVIRSETYQELESDIADLFDAVPEYIRERIEDFSSCCGATDEETFDCLLNTFINEEAQLDLINTLYAYHLTVCADELKRIVPLDSALTDDGSMLKTVLAESKIRIEKINGHLRLFQNDKEISPQIIRNNAPLLAKRLGILGEPDFCVNGFAFWKDIHKTSDDYYERLEHGPEFLQCVDDFLGTKTAMSYRKRYHYYGLVYEVPFSEVIFDGQPELTEQLKKQYYIRNALKMLFGFYLGYPYSGCNPIIRIPDAESATVLYKILAKE